MAEADRWLRMAKVLSAGGFADEAPALLGKSLGGVAQALLSRRGVTATTLVGDDDIRSLIDEAALPEEAWTVAEAARSATAGATENSIEPLIAATARILATVRRNEPGLSLGPAA
jgi:hypothetical protein